MAAYWLKLAGVIFTPISELACSVAVAVVVRLMVPLFVMVTVATSFQPWAVSV